MAGSHPAGSHWDLVEEGKAQGNVPAQHILLVWRGLDESRSCAQTAFTAGWVVETDEREVRA